jgi:adenosylcobyric acid synthase
MLAPAIMVQGTASDAGKSLFVTGLCRLFRDEGISVAPFKSQNMSLNSAVTPDGLEIGRAQAVQAAAAGIPPTVEMNPVLLKPEGGARSQVVVMGKPIGSESAWDYDGRRAYFQDVVTRCLTSLREQHDLVIIEGAGSPAEVNLKDRDVANMYVAKLADAPVLLVGDIDKGGVFASFVGTMAILDPDERDRVAAFVVNKFRGDVALLQPGLDWLQENTGKPTLGVLPYVHGLKIADEDSVSLENRRGRYRPGYDQLDIAVVRLPRISNYDDVLALEHEPKVVVRFVETAEDAEGADLVILPGSKNTALDLAWMRHVGIADVVARRAANGEPVLGICGGCQMLGESIEDPHGVESTEASVQGLGLLPIRTRFAREKITAKVEARRAASGQLMGDASSDEALGGYEIHMGVVERVGSGASAYEIVSRSGVSMSVFDGAVDEAGAVVGTMIHGLMANVSVRADLLTSLARRKGLAYEHGAHDLASADDEYNRLADAVRESMDLDMLWRLAGLTR